MGDTEMTIKKEESKGLYINGVGCISPQFTYDNSVFLPEVKEYNSHKIFCINPDYNTFFDAGSIRRMGRLVKFGTTSGLLALRDAGLEQPGAITTGTGFGLLEVSQKFLKNMIEDNETMVSPTAFIQSTHNTVSANIALHLKCHAHNNTFSHRGFSFESALTDAVLLAREGTDNILTGAYDEVSDYSLAMMKHVGELRAEPCSNLSLFTAAQKGTIAGEGAAFFVLSTQRGANSYGRFVANKAFYQPKDADEVEQVVLRFLADNHTTTDDIDILLSGLCGDATVDSIAREVGRRLFSGSSLVGYKHLCGEYMTSSAFAFWLAAKMMKAQQIPAPVLLENRHRAPKKILLYNRHKANHSLMLLEAV